MFKTICALLAISLAGVSCTRRSSDNENSVSYGLKGHLKALDPAQASEETSNEVLPNIYETLLQYHYLKRPLVTEPLLAKAMPEVSKDGLTVKIRLLEGVRFHDSEVFPEGKGRLVTAEDFVFSWKRLADPRLKGEGFWLFDGKIKGLNEWRDRLAKNEGRFEDPIEGLQTPDAQTLVLRLTRPWYQLNYILAMPYTSVVPHEAVEKYGEEFMNHPVGTGPFVFASWVRGNKVTLKRNPNWHGGTYPTEGAPGDKERGLLADAGKPLPFIDTLVFQEMPESQTRWLNVMKGHLDFMAIPKDNFDSAMDKGQLKPDLAQKGMRIFSAPAQEVVFCGFNMQDPILGSNVELRRALALAYDGETARQKFYNNQAALAHSPLAPDIEGYDPNFRNPYKEFNLAKAKEHLKKAGYPDAKGLPPLEYSVPNTTTDRQMAEYLEQQFAQIGVRVNIVSNSWPQFIERINSRKVQMFGIAWGADYPDQNNMLQTLYSKNASPGPNQANYSNKEFDALFEKAERMPPGPARTELYKKMRDKFVEDMPWIPTVHRINNILYNGWVNNLKRHEAVFGMYKYLRVDLQKKSELRAKL